MDTSTAAHKTPPSTMRAMQLVAYGQPLREHTVPTPAPGPRDVLIEIHAASVNPVDTKIASGTHRAVLRYRLPWTLGLDVSGVVAAVGPEVTRFAPGDEVFAVLDHRRPGSFAEYTLADEAILARKPAALDHHQAAALPLVAMTAWQALVDHGRLTRGTHLLVQAGSGGVGTVALQLARHLGAATIATTCSAANADLVQSLGATHVIDYRTTRYQDVLRDLDLVLDALGGDDRWQALSVLRRGGRHVSIVTDMPQLVERRGPYLGALQALGRVARFTAAARLRHGIRAHTVVMRPDGERLAALAQLAADGALQPVIDSVVPLADLETAFARSRSHRARGKLILAVR